MRNSKTEYKGVYICMRNGKYNSITMNITIKNTRYKGYFNTLREAAIAVDKRLIENGMPPVNILVKKN
jgi:hypothetical protein